MGSLRANTLFRPPQKLLTDRVATWITGSLAAVSAVVISLVIVFLAKESFNALQHVGVVRFFTDQTWHPTSGEFGLGSMVVATIFVTVGALCLAVPLGLLCGIFFRFYAPRLVQSLLRDCLGLLAGLPSVVYGFWGLVVLVPKINSWRPPGASLLAGILVLALMVLPTFALAVDRALHSVPDNLIQSARALGLDTWGVLVTAALPAARKSLLSGMILQATRAIGETMAVVVVCGNIVQVPRSFFDPVRTLTANMALELSYAVGDHRSALFFSGFLLVVLVMLVGGIGRLARRTLVYD